MIKENDKLTKQILTLKELTKTVGGLHEAQINQLRIWFQLLFEEIDPLQAKFDWDVESKTITYSFKTKLKKYLENKQPQLLTLLNSIHFLLGDDWALIFLVNGKRYAVRT